MAPKNIIILSDGTGNSAASTTKTNVWRLYRALDLDPSPAAGKALQVAIYRDGVGSSSFRPQRIIGGIFGVGLSGNVIALYKALSRIYQNGDRIYAFGFSRGAFTIRVLIGLICSQGVLKCATEEELDRYAPEAYRRYRRGYKLPIFGSRFEGAKNDPKDTVGLVDVLRNVRDGIIGLWRKWRRIPPFPPERKVDGTPEQGSFVLPVPTIAFVGVWDTVAAYGLPFDELTRGIDEWVWPLSMPDYFLAEKVERARHALALDEERDSFRPLLWDETQEGALKGDGTDRLLQVWFAGVHANVGGGYPDDTLSFVPLNWIKDEAKQVGLRFAKPLRTEILPPANPYGRLYDSRAGIASYYRYQPRKLRALLDQPGEGTRLLRDPRRATAGGRLVPSVKTGALIPGRSWFLRRIVVHHSVEERIRYGQDRYAPIGLAGDIGVLGSNGQITPLAVTSGNWEQRQEWIWNDVWRRRVAYFATVFASLLLVLFPLLDRVLPAKPCDGPQCLLSEPIRLLHVALPDLASTWLEAFATWPGLFVVLLGVIALLMSVSAILDLKIHDGTRERWCQELGLPLPGKVPHTMAGRCNAPPGNRLFRMRTSQTYQRSLQWLKWRGGPAVFGAGLLLLLCLAGWTVLVSRTVLPLTAWAGGTCMDTTIRNDEVQTKAYCRSTGLTLKAGTTYTLRLDLVSRWRDKSLPATPNGIADRDLRWYMYPAVPARRHLGQPWFKLMARVGSAAGDVIAPDWERVGGADGSGPLGLPGEVWRATITPGVDGQLFLYVNDAALWFGGWPFYDNNHGRATLVVTPPPG